MLPVYLRIFGFLAAMMAALSATAARGSDQVEFNRDVRQILSDKCFACHGPDEQNRKSLLRLDTEQGAKQDLGGRFGIVSGDPEASEVYKRVTHEHEALRMPPVYAPKRLAEAEIETLRRWIEQGAPYQDHWSFTPPRRVDPPQVSKSEWARNSIDRFVLARLEEKGLEPSPEADRAELLRRVSFDITGLPPTLEELDAFLSDDGEDAYERAVDRLLASPRYGERMAIRWLDAARYADTNGYQTDAPREQWRWRDWVIEAFNENMPFDQFTIEQLAGDLLENPTTEQVVATGFSRNHRGNSEGGIVPEEYLVEYSVDRVDTMSTVWMGLTAGCARCHDHKFDPIKQREYYQLFAYFNNIPERGRFFKFGNTPPFVPAPTAEQQAELAGLDEELAKAKKAYRQAAIVNGARSFMTMSPGGDEDIEWFPERALAARAGLNDGAEGRVLSAAEFDGTREVVIEDGPEFGYQDRLTLSAWIYPESSDGAIVSRTQRDPSSEGYGYRGWGLYLIDGKLKFLALNRWLDDGLRVASEDSIPLNRWSHVAAVYDGSRMAEGVQLFVNGEAWATTAELDMMNINFRASDTRVLVGAGGPEDKKGFEGRIDEVRLYSDALSPRVIGALATATPWHEIEHAKTPGAKEKKRLGRLEKFGRPSLRAAWKKLADLRDERQRMVRGFPTVMVMQENPEVSETFLLERGAYDAPGEKVSRGVPSVFPPLPADAPNNRLGLARWLVSDDHPLTSRVMANRVWAMFFGRGIVKTVEDFGSQGEPPTHPELLDWLARELIDSGWDLQHLIKTMVTSATYRQASQATAAEVESDPENALLARGPRVRLPAEMVRDQALATAGLLVEKVGGPSVKPYQPAGLWKETSGQTYEPDSGDGLYRRSLYTFWKRTAPPPFMMNFDSAGREACTVNQVRTNTPLQALNLMNDVTYVEASRKLAERMMTEGGDAPAQRIGYGFRLLTARSPKAKESEVLVRSYQHYLDRFQSTPADAEGLLSEGESPRSEALDAAEHAAFTAVAGLMLNLDEAITKE